MFLPAKGGRNISTHPILLWNNCKVWFENKNQQDFRVVHEGGFYEQKIQYGRAGANISAKAQTAKTCKEKGL